MKTTANIAGTKAEISATLKLSSGTVLLETRDFVQSSLVFKTGTSNSGEFTVGAAIIGGVDFALMNDTGKFSGLSWGGGKVDITLSFGETATLRMGEFYIVSHRETGKIVSVECHDALKVLDEHELYEVLNETAVTGSITFPTTIAALANAIAAYNGCTISGLQHGDIQIDDPGNDHMTQRACLSYLAQMTGQYVTAHNDVLTFGWYDMASVHDAGTTFSHDLETDDIIITGVNVSDSGDTVTETLGSAGHMVNIADNPFVSASNAAAVASAVFAAVDGLQYRPGTVEIMSNAAIEAGDVLSIRTGQESGIVIIASTVTYKASTLRQSITADAEAYAGDLRVTQSQYFKRVAKQAISDDLHDPNSDLSKAIGSGGSTASLEMICITNEVPIPGDRRIVWIKSGMLTKEIKKTTGAMMFQAPESFDDGTNTGNVSITNMAVNYRGRASASHVNNYSADNYSTVRVRPSLIVAPSADAAKISANNFGVMLTVSAYEDGLRGNLVPGATDYDDFYVSAAVSCQAHWDLDHSFMDKFDSSHAGQHTEDALVIAIPRRILFPSYELDSSLGGMWDYGRNFSVMMLPPMVLVLEKHLLSSGEIFWQDYVYEDRDARQGNPFSWAINDDHQS